MSNFLEKIGVGEQLRKNIMVILLISASGTIIYGLPYFRYDYYDVYLEVYNLTNTQMGVFGSIFGILGMISYLFGGFIVDMFSAKKILSVSLILTGIGGFLHLLPLTFPVLVVLYAVWGLTSLFAFWPACIKAVRLITDADDSGKGFGIFEGARGVVAAIVAPLGVIAFRIGAGNANDVNGMKAVIIFHSVITVLTGILILMKMKDFKVSSDDKIKLKDVAEVIKMPAVWIIGLATFCTYVFTLSLYYFTPYSTSLLGASVVFGASVAATRRFISPLGNVAGGFISDKIGGTANLLLTSFVVLAVGTIGILALPLSSSSLPIFVAIFIVMFFFYNVNYALTWAMMEEAKIPLKTSGTAAGVIATIGYLPEIFCSLLAGILIDNNPGVQGFRYYFSFLIVMMVVGAIVVFVWKTYLKKGDFVEERN